jgi:carbon monoxide dehydrogenase subunit G
MELVNEFTVNRPIDEAWAILTDIEKIAPCLPGAELHEIEGDVYRGVVKVKVGPIKAALQGEATFLERDDIAHRAVLRGDGRDTKGNGNASAVISASLEELSSTSSRCVVKTDLNMTGKVAQFGRGALSDISTKLMSEFAQNLDVMLAAGTGQDETGESGEEPDDAVAAPTTSVRTISGPAAEPIDVVSLGGGTVLKRLLPVVGGLVILIVALRRRQR